MRCTSTTSIPIPTTFTLWYTETVQTGVFQPLLAHAHSRGPSHNRMPNIQLHQMGNRVQFANIGVINAVPYSLAAPTRGPDSCLPQPFDFRNRFAGSQIKATRVQFTISA